MTVAGSTQAALSAADDRSAIMGGTCRLRISARRCDCCARAHVLLSADVCAERGRFPFVCIVAAGMVRRRHPAGLTVALAERWASPRELRAWQLALAVAVGAVAAVLTWQTFTLIVLREGLGIRLFRDHLGTPVNWIGGVFYHSWLMLFSAGLPRRYTLRGAGAPVCCSRCVPPSLAAQRHSNASRKRGSLHCRRALIRIIFSRRLPGWNDCMKLNLLRRIDCSTSSSHFYALRSPTCGHPLRQRRSTRKPAMYRF